MKNKTVLQDLIEEIHEFSELVKIPLTKEAINLIMGMAENKLEKEKEQIENAWRHGAIRSPENLKHINNSSLYYKEMYETDRKKL